VPDYFWLRVAGWACFGRLWLVVSCFGFWLVVSNFGLLWVIVGGCMLITSKVPKHVFYINLKQ